MRAVGSLVRELSSFPSPDRSITIKDYLLSFHGAEGVGSNRFADVSVARGRSAGHAVYSLGREGTGSRTRCQEVETAVRRSPRAPDLRSSLLRGSRTAGVGASRFVRSVGITAGI